MKQIETTNWQQNTIRTDSITIVLLKLEHNYRINNNIVLQSLSYIITIVLQIVLLSYSNT